MNKDFLDLNELSTEDILFLLDLSDKVKANPLKYSSSLNGKTLLMIFEKPSLRTRVSFEVGMTQMGGHAIYYDVSTSPMGKKESIADTVKTASRYVDIIMARLFSHQQIIDMAKNASVPVINALTDFSHPCQILADLQTIREIKGKLKGLTLVYLGDSNNNVTHSLMQGCTKVGINVVIGCPANEEFMPNKLVVENCTQFAKENKCNLKIVHNSIEAVQDADVIYTDSWMSYHIPEDQKQRRVQTLMPFQVKSELFKYTKNDAIFMHCLPAVREIEQTTDVIDGPHSVVFDQAENRLHTEKALILKLLRLE